MGLDVYLYHIDDIARKRDLTERYNAKSESVWGAAGEYSLLADAQETAIRRELQAFALSLGLDAEGDYPGMQRVNIDSRLYPSHMFKIGYFRSSYNSGGINNLMRQRTGIDLADIFSENGELEYEFAPDWQECKRRAIEALERWRATTSEYGKSYILRTVDALSIAGKDAPQSDESALAVFYDEMDRYHSSRNSDPDFSSYSNRFGEFHLDRPMMIAGAVPGQKYGSPCVYLIVEQPPEGEQWYLQALEIVLETCEYVLDRPDADKYYLHWSS